MIVFGDGIDKNNQAFIDGKTNTTYFTSMQREKVAREDLKEGKFGL